MNFYNERTISVSLLFPVLLLLAPVWINGEGTLPKPSGPVADYAAIIETESEQIINGIARKLWVEYRFGIVIATLPFEIRETPETFVRQLFDEWEIGKSREAFSALMVIGPKGEKNYLLGSEKCDSIVTSERLALISERFTADVTANGLPVSEALLLSVNALKDIARKADTPATMLTDNTSTMRKCYKATLLSVGVLLSVMLFIFLHRVNLKTGNDFYDSLRFGGSIENREFGGGIKNR